MIFLYNKNQIEVLYFFKKKSGFLPYKYLLKSGVSPPQPYVFSILGTNIKAVESIL
jgi:hypothetical protein